MITNAENNVVKIKFLRRENANVMRIITTILFPVSVVNALKIVITLLSMDFVDVIQDFNSREEAAFQMEQEILMMILLTILG